MLITEDIRMRLGLGLEVLPLCGERELGAQSGGVSEAPWGGEGDSCMGEGSLSNL